MLYKLINPSDPYTFEAEDLETAALAVLSLSPMFGAESEDGKHCVPLLIGSEEDLNKWFKENFGRTIEEALEEKRDSLGAALASMLYGDFGDRKVYEMAVQKIDDPAKREAFASEWQDRRSSMNDIGSYAQKLGQKILRQKKEDTE